MHKSRHCVHARACTKVDTACSLLHVHAHADGHVGREAVVLAVAGVQPRMTVAAVALGGSLVAGAQQWLGVVSSRASNALVSTLHALSQLQIPSNSPASFLAAPSPQHRFRILFCKSNARHQPGILSVGLMLYWPSKHLTHEAICWWPPPVLKAWCSKKRKEKPRRQRYTPSINYGKGDALAIATHCAAHKSITMVPLSSLPSLRLPSLCLPSGPFARSGQTLACAARCGKAVLTLCAVAYGLSSTCMALPALPSLCHSVWPCQLCHYCRSPAVSATLLLLSHCMPLPGSAMSLGPANSTITAGSAPFFSGHHSAGSKHSNCECSG